MLTSTSVVPCTLFNNFVICRLLTENKIDGTHDQYLQFDTSSAHKVLVIFIYKLPVKIGRPIGPTAVRRLASEAID